MNSPADRLHDSARDLLEAAHGIAAAGTAAGVEPAIPAALACMEESLALLALGADAMAGLHDLAAALREARRACERAAVV
ncbi:MAG: hypothetical protein WD844_04570 [Thermoleophilaceae bacterium]